MLKKSYYDLKSPKEVKDLVGSVCDLKDKEIKKVTDQSKLENEVIYTLQFNASINGDQAVKLECIEQINRLAGYYNILSGSNNDFYDEKAEGDHQFFTVPAINVRMAAFHIARAAIIEADKQKLPHIIFELAISEGGYTGQSVAEWTALVRAAYISLGIKERTVFLQADHYKLDPKKYAKEASQEIESMKERIVQAMESGVYNVDLDASHFETDDSTKSDEENQSENARLTAELFCFIRSYEQKHKLPVSVSIGAEVGEVGGTNTKYPQVNAFLKLFSEEVNKLGFSKAKGLSKIAINVGSAHGGVLGPDGNPLDTVPLDFIAHHDLYMKGRDSMNPNRHIISVQHGASTLPKKYFALFPALHVAEVHLATGFQDIFWDALKENDNSLYKQMESLVHDNFSEDKKKYETEAIWFKKLRKKVTQFVKKDLLLSPALPTYEKNLQQEFSTLFNLLYTLLLPSDARQEKGERDD